jgi:hypothetical protein
VGPQGAQWWIASATWITTEIGITATVNASQLMFLGWYFGPSVLPNRDCRDCQWRAHLGALHGDAAAIALLSLLFWSEAFAQARTHWYCQFTPFGEQNVRYHSDVFAPTENAMSVGGSTQQDIVAAFEDSVAGKYSESGSAGCSYFDSAISANDDKKQNDDLVTKNGGRFIETGWRYRGPP